MAILFEIEHVTSYKYANTVTFDTHRAMFLPRPRCTGAPPPLVRKNYSCFQDSVGERYPLQ